MEIEITDGKGSDIRAEVTALHRLSTDSISRTQLEYACLTGNGYNVSTGTMTLTTDGESAVGYFEYLGEEILIIKEILVIIGGSTGGSGLATIKLIKNPTSGTIVSNADPVASATNRDFSSFNTLVANAYKGAEGYTMTDGDVFAVTTRDNSAQVITFDAAPIVLRRGNSIGVKFTPPTGNTSQSVVVAGTVYEELTNIG